MRETRWKAALTRRVAERTTPERLIGIKGYIECNLVCTGGGIWQLNTSRAFYHRLTRVKFTCSMFVVLLPYDVRPAPPSYIAQSHTTNASRLGNLDRYRVVGAALGIGLESRECYSGKVEHGQPIGRG